MVSAENEMVRFRDNIVPAKSKGMVELWMAEVATRMKDSLVHCTDQALQQWTARPQLPYLRAFPGQCIYCASALHWTRALSQHLTGGVDQPPQWQVRPLYLFFFQAHLLLQSHQVPIIDCSGSGRDGPRNAEAPDFLDRRVQRAGGARDAQQLDRLLHPRYSLFGGRRRRSLTGPASFTGLETVRRLKAKNVSSVQDYHWLSLIRHYWDTSDVEEPGNMLVAMVTTTLSSSCFRRTRLWH